VTVTPYSYWFSDGTHGCVMAETKARAIMTILELNPTQLVIDLSLHVEPEWTSKPHCESQAANTSQIQKS
jgi:hypothetical protein